MSAPRGAEGRYDVAVLGTDLTAASLAAILARRGRRVVMIAPGTHPRFAIGETAVPYTSELCKLLAERYGVPEFADLAGFGPITKAVSRAVGRGRTLGFVWHRQDGTQEPAHLAQIASPKPMPAEATLYRQDIDAHLFHAAVRYGADARQQAPVEEVRTGDDDVVVTTARGEVYRARYVVDTGGGGGVLAGSQGVAELPTRYRARSRSVYTHLVGVRPFDEVCGQDRRAPVRWDQGTLYHLFDGGYLWAIPFGNHGAATNHACSAGLALDADRFPGEGSPEEEFRAVLDRLPVARGQFEHATAVQPWTSTGRLQHSVSRAFGERWCVLGDAAGEVDPFLSRSLVTSLEVVNALAGRLLSALRDDELGPARFDYVERLQSQMLDVNDQLATMVYQSLSDPLLFKAVLRVWEVGSLYGTLQLRGANARLRRTGDESALRELENLKYLGSPFPGHDDYNQLLRATSELCDAAATGGEQPRVAAERLFTRLGGETFVPKPFGFDDPRKRFYNPGVPDLLRLAVWSRTGAPGEIRELMSQAMGR